MNKICKIEDTNHGTITVRPYADGSCRLYHIKEQIEYGPRFNVSSIIGKEVEWANKVFSFHPNLYFELMKMAGPIKKSKMEEEEVNENDLILPPEIVDKELRKYSSDKEIFEWLSKTSKSNFVKYKPTAMKIMTFKLKNFFKYEAIKKIDEFLPTIEFEGVIISADEVINIEITKNDVLVIQNYADLVEKFPNVKKIIILDNCDNLTFGTQRGDPFSDHRLESFVIKEKRGFFKFGGIFANLNVENVEIMSRVNGYFRIPETAERLHVPQKYSENVFFSPIDNININSGETILLNRVLKEIKIGDFRRLDLANLSLEVFDAPNLKTSNIGNFDVGNLRYYDSSTFFLIPQNESRRVISNNLEHLVLHGKQQRAYTIFELPELKFLDTSDAIIVGLDLSKSKKLEKVNLKSFDSIYKQKIKLPQDTIEEIQFVAAARKPDSYDKKEFLSYIKDFFTWKNKNLRSIVIKKSFKQYASEENFAKMAGKNFPSLLIVKIDDKVLYSKPQKKMPKKTVPKGDDKEEDTGAETKMKIDKSVAVPKFTTTLVSSYLKNAREYVTEDFSNIENMNIKDASNSMYDSKGYLISNEIKKLLADENVTQWLMPVDEKSYVFIKDAILLTPKNMPEDFMNDIVSITTRIERYPYFLSKPNFSKIIFMYFDTVYESVLMYANQNDKELFGLLKQKTMMNKIESVFKNAKEYNFKKLEVFSGISKGYIYEVNSEVSKIISYIKPGEDDVLVFVGHQVYWHAYIARNSSEFFAKAIHIPETNASYKKPSNSKEISKYTVTEYRRKGFATFFDIQTDFSDDSKPRVPTNSYTVNQATKFWLISQEGASKVSVDSIYFELMKSYPFVDTQNFTYVDIGRSDDEDIDPIIRQTEVKINRIKIGTPNIVSLNISSEETTKEVGTPGYQEYPPVQWPIFGFNPSDVKSDFAEAIFGFFQFNFEKVNKYQLSPSPYTQKVVQVPSSQEQKKSGIFDDILY